MRDSICKTAFADGSIDLLNGGLSQTQTATQIFFAMSQFNNPEQLITQRREFVFQENCDLFHSSRTPDPAMALERKKYGHADRSGHQ